VKKEYNDEKKTQRRQGTTKGANLCRTAPMSLPRIHYLDRAKHRESRYLANRFCIQKYGLQLVSKKCNATANAKSEK